MVESPVNGAAFLFGRADVRKRDHVLLRHVLHDRSPIVSAE